MAASVIILWLVTAFLGGAFSLTCYHCNAVGNSCDEKEKLCEPLHDACITTITEIRQVDKATQQKSFKHLVKSCGEKKSCNQTYSMSFNTTRLYATTTCCESDKCKAVMLEVKIQDKETQKKCPYCFGLNAKCSETDKTSCFGEQTKCASLVSKDATNQSVTNTWKGCVTENVCSMKTIATLPLSQTLGSQPQCDRAPSLLPGLLLPATFGLAFLKLLL